ncbi:unnamed protein product, partial [Musa textilis]
YTSGEVGAFPSYLFLLFGGIVSLEGWKSRTSQLVGREMYVSNSGLLNPWRWHLQFLSIRKMGCCSGWRSRVRAFLPHFLLLAKSVPVLHVPVFSIMNNRSCILKLR